MTHSRISGLLVAGFGLLLLLVLIPEGTEQVDYGWLRPATLPAILAWVLILSGLWTTLENRGAPVAPGQIARAMGLLALIAGGLWLMGQIGFLYTAPLLTLVLMLLIGERRPFWLALGVLGVPALIWFAVTELLSRPLP